MPIFAEQRHVFSDALSDEQAIERIFVVGWQQAQLVEMLRLEMKRLNPVAENMLTDKALDRKGDSEASKANFDGHFPKRSNAEPAGVGWVLDSLASGLAQTGVGSDEPEEGMGIK